MDADMPSHSSHSSDEDTLIENVLPSNSNKNKSLTNPVKKILKREASNAGDKSAKRPKERRLEVKNGQQHESKLDPTVNNNYNAVNNFNENNGNSIPNQVQHDNDELTYRRKIGPASTFPGIVYQLKHLGCTLLRAMNSDKELSFRLSSERVNVGQFDDLVLHYRNNERQNVDLFLQLKHSQVKGGMVKASDLLNMTDGFSIQKYFISWREIKRNPEFSGNSSKKLILGTNIELDLSSLEKEEIKWKKVERKDQPLEMIEKNSNTKCFVFEADKEKNPKLYNELKRTSVVHSLARTLAEHVWQNKAIEATGLFARYHTALVEQVIDTQSKKFRDTFTRKNASNQNFEHFREILVNEFSKRVKKSAHKPEWADIPLNLSKGFGKRINLSLDPNLTNIPKFTQKFVKLINWETCELEVSRQEYRENAAGSETRAFVNDINKLAGYVLIREKQRVRFRQNFIDGVIESGGTIAEFRTELECKLKQDGKTLQHLSKLEFKRTKFSTYEEEQLYSNAELPVDNISDDDITEFLEIFNLVVNLPDEKNLGKLMTGEIGHRLKLLNADIMGSYFLMQIVDWFKENASGRQSTYLTYTKGADIIRKLGNQVQTLFSEQLDSLYRYKLEEYDIDFKEEKQYLTEFLDEKQDKNTLIHILILQTSEETLLSTLRVHRAVSKLERTKAKNRTEHEKKYSTFFIRLQTLMERQMYKDVLDSESETSYDLFIVEVDSLSTRRDQDLENVCQAIAKSKIKKMILIAGKDQISNYSLTEKLRAGEGTICISEKVDEEINFSHFTKTSQDNLLKLKQFVNLQGYSTKISFERLLGLHDTPNGNLKTMEYLQELDSSALVQLIRSKLEIRIGEGGLHKVKPTYINRSITSPGLIRKEFSQAKSRTDLLDSSIRNSKNKELSYRVNELVDLNGLIIISGRAGMGKSATITYLASQIKKQYPELLVLKINLRDKRKALKKLTEKEFTFEKTVKFLVDELLTEKTNVSKVILKSMIDAGCKVALLFDEFDAINSESHRETALNLLHTLKEHRSIKKLFVAIKPHTIEYLEQKWGKSGTFQLQPFSPQEQEDFLTNFWKNSSYSNCDQEIEDRIKKYAKAITKTLADLSNDQKDYVTGIPRETEFVAMILQNACKERKRERPSGGRPSAFDSLEKFINSKRDDPNLPNGFDVFHLYEDLVDRKIYAFIEECEQTNEMIENEGVRFSIYNSFMNKHEKWGLDAVLGHEKSDKFLQSDSQSYYMTQWHENLKFDKSGVFITEFIDEKPQFRHRTDSDFFAAKFLSSNLKNTNHNEIVIEIFVKDIFLESNYQILRTFINCWLSDRDNQQIFGESWTRHLKTCQNDQNQTVFHVAAADGNGRLMGHFLYCFREDSSILKTLIGHEDKSGQLAVDLVKDGNS